MTHPTVTTLKQLTQPETLTAEFCVEVASDSHKLEGYASEMRELSSATLEPNPFYEDWMLIPAFKFLKADLDVHFVLVFARKPSQPKERLLCGLFPLVLNHRWKGSPYRVYSLWQHFYFSLCTPLIRDNYGRKTLEAFFDWLASDREGCLLIEFNLIASGGPFNSMLADFLKERKITNLTFNRFERGVYYPKENADARLWDGLSKKYQSQLRRKRTRLEELGRLEFAELRPGGNVLRWIDDFLDLEAKGWKGREKSALGCNERSRSFFVEAAKEAFSRGRLRMLQMRSDGRLIAQRCSFVCGQQSFLFKLAYDEDYARFSPGILLELENMSYLNAAGCVEDSCAAPDHPVFNHLWVERKTIQTTLAAWSRSGALAIYAIELYRWFKRKLPAQREKKR